MSASTPPGIRILIRDQPHRAIALATDTHVLILKHSPDYDPKRSHLSSRNASSTSLPAAGNGVHSAPRCMAEFGRVDTLDSEDFRTLSFRDVFGTLGLITVNNEVFLCVVSSATKAAEVRPGETVQKINSVEFREWIRLASLLHAD